MTNPRTTTEETGLTTAGIETYLTSLSNWGRWGDDDRIGTLNSSPTRSELQQRPLSRPAGPFRYPARSARSTQTRWTRVSHWCSLS